MEELQSQQPTAKQSTTLAITPKNANDIQKQIDSLEKSMTIIDPSDMEQRIKIHKAFYLKTTDKATLDPESPLYGELVTAVIKKGRSLNYLPIHLDKACERFLFSKQYGNKIDVAAFFEDNEQRERMLTESDKQQRRRMFQFSLEKAAAEEAKKNGVENG